MQRPLACHASGQSRTGGCDREGKSCKSRLNYLLPQIFLGGWRSGRVQNTPRAIIQGPKFQRPEFSRVSNQDLFSQECLRAYQGPLGSTQPPQLFPFCHRYWLHDVQQSELVESMKTWLKWKMQKCLFPFWSQLSSEVANLSEIVA